MLERVPADEHPRSLVDRSIVELEDLRDPVKTERGAPQAPVTSGRWEKHEHQRRRDERRDLNDDVWRQVPADAPIDHGRHPDEGGGPKDGFDAGRHVFGEHRHEHPHERQRDGYPIEYQSRVVRVEVVPTRAGANEPGSDKRERPGRSLRSPFERVRAPPGPDDGERQVGQHIEGIGDAPHAPRIDEVVVARRLFDRAQPHHGDERQDHARERDVVSPCQHRLPMDPKRIAGVAAPWWHTKIVAGWIVG
jgi:hypothetical protein